MKVTRRLNGKPLKAAVTVFAVAVVLCAAEAAVRYRESRRASQNGPMSPLYYPHRRLQRAFVRESDYYGRVHINRHGFRGPDIEVRKAPGTTRIMAVGASATFDVCARRDSESWPARLQHWLGALAPGREYEVINAGVPGYLILDNIIRLQSELHAFAPDVILLYAGHGTVTHTDLPLSGGVPRARREPSNTPDAMPVVAPWGSWLGRHSLLYHKVSLQLQSLSRETGDRETAVSDERWEQAIASLSQDFRRDLVSFVTIAQGLGAKVVVVELAHVSGSSAKPSASEEAIWKGAFPSPPEVTLEGYRRFGAVQRAVADSLGVTFVPANNFGIAGQQHYCTSDPIHFNTAGAELMGRKLAESLLARDALRHPRGP